MPKSKNPSFYVKPLAAESYNPATLDGLLAVNTQILQQLLEIKFILLATFREQNCLADFNRLVSDLEKSEV